MTAKRFNSYCDNENIKIRIDDDIKNKEVFHIYFVELDDALYCKSKLNPILDLLNQLSDENEQLKARINYIENKIQRERKSNIIQHEKWEKEATDLIREQRKFIDDLNKENEQLKQQCKDFMEMLDDMCIAYLVNDGLEEILND